MSSNTHVMLDTFPLCAASAAGWVLSLEDPGFDALWQGNNPNTAFLCDSEMVCPVDLLTQDRHKKTGQEGRRMQSCP